MATNSIDKEIKENAERNQILKRNLALENNIPDSVELRKLQKPKKEINYDQIQQNIKNETAELILRNVKTTIQRY